LVAERLNYANRLKRLKHGFPWYEQQIPVITVNPIQKLVVWVPLGGCEEMISYLFEARAELTRTAAWRQCWMSALGRVVYTMVYFFVRHCYT